MALLCTICRNSKEGEIVTYRMAHEGLSGGPYLRYHCILLLGRDLWMCALICMQDCFCSFLFLIHLMDSQPITQTINISQVPTLCWALL